MKNKSEKEKIEIKIIENFLSVADRTPTDIV